MVAISIMGSGKKIEELDPVGPLLGARRFAVELAHAQQFTSSAGTIKHQ